jgi:hypothetical protein
MLIDCDGCAVRGPGCPDCVVTVLLGAGRAAPVELDEVERRALAVLAEARLVPPLRLVAGRPEPAPEDGERAGTDRDNCGELPHKRTRHAAG